MIPTTAFPRLTPENHRITSPATTDYNCIAWSAQDTENWWQPGVYWLIDASFDDYGIAALVQVFESLGYERCEGDSLEEGFEKVALYSNNQFYTHAARQLRTGKWTSKLGASEDIEHDTPEDVGDGVYGNVAMLMKRPLVRASLKNSHKSL